MYCNACGKPNPDGSSFCSACGKPLIAPPREQAQQAAPTYQTITMNAVRPEYVREDDINPQVKFESRFRSAWREFVSSGFALTLIILQSVLVVLNVIEMESTISSIEALLQIANIAGGMSSALFESDEFTIVVLKILMMAPSILTAVGMWMIYADARNRTDFPISVSGLKLIRGVQIAGMVVFCLYLMGMLFASCSLTSGLSNSSVYNQVMVTVVATIIIVGGLGIVYMRTLIKLTETIRDSAELCYPDTSYVKAVAIIQFIVAGFGAIGLFSVGFTVGTVLSCTQMIMIGVVLMKYNSLMQMLYYEKQSIKKLAHQEYASIVINRGSETPDTWTCRTCGTLNSNNYTQCKKCGIYKWATK